MSESAATLAPMAPAVWRVADSRRETDDTRTFALEPLDGEPMRFAPGQFNMPWVFGIGEAPISISGDPTRPGPVVHTVRAVGAVSRGLCALRPGDTLGLRGPFGSAWPVDAAAGSDVLIVAGGIGLAPLRPVVYEVLARRRRYGRVVLLYGARTPRDILFRSELQSWRGRFDLDVEVTVDHPAGQPFEHVGVVTRLIETARLDPPDTVAFVCGPEVMMRFAVADLLDRGIAPGNVHVSLERNMKCAIGLCGHCQLGPVFVCRDGPVFRWADVERRLAVREL